MFRNFSSEKIKAVALPLEDSCTDSLGWYFQSQRLAMKMHILEVGPSLSTIPSADQLDLVEKKMGRGRKYLKYLISLKKKNLTISLPRENKPKYPDFLMFLKLHLFHIKDI